MFAGTTIENDRADKLFDMILLFDSPFQREQIYERKKVKKRNGGFGTPLHAIILYLF